MRISGFLKLIIILSFISVICTAGTANPEEDPIHLANLGIEELMNVHVTSVSKKQELQFDAPAAVYVITGENIRRMGVRSITDALRIVPGVEVAQINDNTIRETIGSQAFILGEIITISIGVVGLKKGEDRSSWMKRCDENLYKAKTGGRNTVVAS